MDVVTSHNPFYDITDDYSQIVLYAEDEDGNVHTIEWTPEEVRNNLDTDLARDVIEEAIRYGQNDIKLDEDKQRIVYNSHIDGLSAAFPFTYEYRDEHDDESVSDDVKRNGAGQVLARVNVSSSGLLEVNGKNAFELEAGSLYKGATNWIRANVETAGLF